MDLISWINTFLALGVVLGQVFIILSLAYFLLFREKQPVFVALLQKRGVLLAFLTALLASFSSLFYSEVAGFAPCELCWVQRLFMYPLVFILGWYLVSKNKKLFLVAMAFTILGFFVSLYHNFLYYSQGGLAVTCTLAGTGASCIKRYVFEFGYITIPMMALTAFALIIAFLLFTKTAQGVSQQITEKPL